MTTQEVTLFEEEFLLSRLDRLLHLLLVGDSDGMSREFDCPEEILDIPAGDTCVTGATGSCKAVPQ